MPTSQMQNALLLALVGLSLWLPGSRAAKADLLRSGGTGAAVETLRHLGVAFAKIEPDLKFEVIEGLGSSGGIAAVAAGAIDFSVAGRPLGAADDRSLKSSIIARTPFGLASSHENPGDIRRVDVEDMFGSPTAVWSDGKPVRVILRPKSDSDSQLLVSFFPNMAAVMEKLRRRAELPVAATDQDNVMLAERLAGSLTTITAMQMQTENPRLKFLTVDGVAPTLQNFERGTYPYGKDLYLVIPSRTIPALDRFVAFLGSTEGRNILRANGSLPVQP
jgi:phosphate transport system substrate-binding protein